MPMRGAAAVTGNCDIDAPAVSNWLSPCRARHHRRHGVTRRLRSTLRRACRGAGMAACNKRRNLALEKRRMPMNLTLALPDGRRQAAFAPLSGPLTRTTLRLCATRADACNAEREPAHWPVTLLSGDAASLARPLLTRYSLPATTASLPSTVAWAGMETSQPSRALQHHLEAPRHQRWAEAARKQGRQGGRGSRRRSCGPGRRVGCGRAAAGRGGRPAHH